MKKLLIKGISVLLLLVVFISSLNLFVAAAPSSNIIFSSKSVKVGEQVSVTVKFSADEPMMAAQFSLSYDSKVLQYVSCNKLANGAGAGLVSVAYGISAATSDSCTIVFKAIGVGSSYVGTSNLLYVNYDEKRVNLTNQGSNITVTTNQPALSTNTNLKSLSVSAGKLSPAFSAGRTSYTVNVKNSVTTCKISAVAADGDAKVNVYPNNNTALKVGTNTRTVTVTAPSGHTKKYTVNIIRSETDDVVSSDADTTSSETPTEDPLLIMDGSFASYTILSDLTGITLLKGFTATEAQHNGAAISVATDEKGEYKLYYLKSPEGDETVICTYDEDTKTFKKVSYITQGNYTHIVAELPEGYNLPSSYFTTNAKIGNFDIKCYGKTSSDEFYYIYCYTNGTYGFYRYDTVEGVLQRFPELRPTQAVVTVPEEKEEYNFAERFNSLTSNSKIILVCLVAIALAIIAIIVLLIVKLATRKKVKDANNFDDFDINDTFYITDSEDNDSDESEE